MPHSFAWSVKDEATNNSCSHRQERDGKVTTGSYRVALPDCRTQIVTHRADDKGYVAQVKYEGEAKKSGIQNFVFLVRYNTPKLLRWRSKGCPEIFKTLNEIHVTNEWASVYTCVYSLLVEQNELFGLYYMRKTWTKVSMAWPSFVICLLRCVYTRPPSVGLSSKACHPS